METLYDLFISVQKMKKRAARGDDPIGGGLQLPAPIPCSNCKNPTLIVYVTPGVSATCTSCAILLSLYESLGLLLHKSEIHPDDQLEILPPVYVQNNGGDIKINNIIDLTEKRESTPEAEENLDKPSPVGLPPGTVLEWYRDENGKMVSKPYATRTLSRTSSTPRRFLSDEGAAAESEIAAGLYSMPGPGVKTASGGAYQSHHIEETPQFDIASLGEDAPLYEGYKPGRTRIASANDVMRYEANYGDPELMAMLEEEDREIEASMDPLELRLIRNRLYTGIVKTSPSIRS